METFIYICLLSFLIRKEILRLYLPMAFLILRLKFYLYLKLEFFQYNLYVYDKYLYFIDIIFFIILIYDLFNCRYNYLNYYFVVFSYLFEISIYFGFFFFKLLFFYNFFNIFIM